MWSEKRQLVKYAGEIAKKKHPEGFNKGQLIEASKEVFGGFGADKTKPIKTKEDINHRLNEMALIDGHYPLSMTGCEVVGINGGCGADCPVFADGECGEPQEFTPEYLIDELGEEDAKEAMSFYSCFYDWLDENQD